MSLKQRIKSGVVVYTSAVGISLLDSLWAELLREWADPDNPDPVMTREDEYDAGYCVGLAYAIAKIRYPYVPASERIERVLDEARSRKNLEE